MTANLYPPVVEDIDEDNVLDKSNLPSGFITVDIPPWADIAIGNTGTVYFGTHTRPFIVKDLSKIVSVEFSPGNISDGVYSVYYTAKDMVNPESTSPKVNVTVKSSEVPGGVETYSAPILPQAINGTIDLAGITEDIYITYTIPASSNAVPGNKVKIFFGSILAEDILSFPLSMQRGVFIDKSKVKHGLYSVYFEVWNDTSLIGRSLSTTVECLVDVVIYPPEFPQLIKGSIPLDGEYIYIDMNIPHYDAEEIGDSLQCYIGDILSVQVVEDATASVFTARFDKERINPGTYEAYYYVVKSDGYTIPSDKVSVTFTKSGSGGGGGGGGGGVYDFEETLKKMNAGSPFYIKNFHSGGYISPVTIEAPLAIRSIPFRWTAVKFDKDVTHFEILGVEGDAGWVTDLYATAGKTYVLNFGRPSSTPQEARFEYQLVVSQYSTNEIPLCRIVPLNHTGFFVGYDKVSYEVLLQNSFNDGNPEVDLQIIFYNEI